MYQEQPLSSTRQRILELLWRGLRTVEELARHVGLTDNAVRAHLVALERDGLIRKDGLRRGVRKPSIVYACAPAAEQLLPKPYPVVLSVVLDELVARLGREATVDVLRRVGERLADEHKGRFRGLDEAGKMRELAGLVAELGGIAEIEPREGGYRLRGYSCPLRAVVAEQPDACAVIHALIGGVLQGATVRECCECDGAARCMFEIER